MVFDHADIFLILSIFLFLLFTTSTFDGCDGPLPFVTDASI